MIVTVDMLVAVGIFVLVVMISRYVSLGSILAAASVPLTLVFRENILHDNIQSYNTLLPFVVAVSLLVIFTHRKNVVRLLNGTENKLSFKKK
jgi:glycerol-3-phosphate acyltransferase PlsY